MFRPSRVGPLVVALALLAIAAVSEVSLGQQPPQQGSEPERGAPRPLTEEEVQQRLAEVTRLELHDVPLADAAELIGSEHNLPVFLDRRALADVGVDSSTPVSADYPNLRLGTALELMLREWDLTYIVGEGALIVTTQEEAEQRLETRVYSVYELVYVHDWMTPPEARQPEHARHDFDSLISLVTTTVNPTTWDAVGGPGTIAPLPPDLLVVSQTREVHEELAGLLETLRRLPSAAEQPSPDEPEQLSQLVGSIHPVSGVLDSYFQIRNTLDDPTHLELIDVPLVEVARLVSSRHDIPVLLDRRALQDVGLDADLPVTGQYRGLPLRQILGRLLEQHELEYVITDEVLMITTEEEAEQRLSLRLYPVIDLVRMRTEDEGWLAMDFDGLINVIQTSIHQDSWDVVGGPGTVQAFPQRAVLAIDQTQQVHEEIESLLADVRRQRKAAGPPDGAVRPPREQVVTLAYPLAVDLNERDQAALRDLIEKTVRPESWGKHGDEERLITFLPGKIIVHNRHDVQQEVRELLARIGMIANVPLGGGLGRGGLGAGGGFGGGGFGGGGFFAPAPKR